jgi:hypothetical protein
MAALVKVPMTPATLPKLLRTVFLTTALVLVVPRDLRAQERLLRPEIGATDVQLAIVRHHWQARIIESNCAALRPGSIYDMITYFEQNFGFPRPTFNYRFIDTGLGTADPLYPLYQTGYQGSWNQLLPAFVSNKSRHLDHFSSVRTPEGCQVDAVYLVRHIDDFPDRYHQERADGYTLVDIGFNHYTRLTPDAQCGRHVSHAPDPDFEPLKAIQPFLENFRSLADIPPDLLSRYEAKVALLKPVSNEFSRTTWPRFDEVYSLEKNSLWYYPNAFAKAYGIRDPRPQLDLEHLKLPEHFVIPASERSQEAFGLRRVLDEDAFGKYLDIMNGHPTPGFDPETEPGNDAFSVAQVTEGNFYTSGLEVRPIERAAEDISNPDHYKLVGMVVRPYQPETDLRWTGTRVVPQVRLVYQLMDTLDHDHPLEQVYLHLVWDVVDRYAPGYERDAQHRRFLRALDHRTSVGEHDARAEEITADLIRTSTRRPIQTLSMSSSLTGIWVFASLSRSFDPARELSAVRIVRQGIDVGYYSTAYDNDLFRQELNRSTGERKKAIAEYLDDLTPEFYRDPRRMNPHTIDFNRVTCAQCHQTAARDGVHMTINDRLDRRITSPVRVSEFIYREIDRQLRGGRDHWQAGLGSQSNHAAALLDRGLGDVDAEN